MGDEPEGERALERRPEHAVAQPPQHRRGVAPPAHRQVQGRRVGQEGRRRAEAQGEGPDRGRRGAQHPQRLRHVVEAHVHRWHEGEVRRHPIEGTVVARQAQAVDLGGDGLGEQEGDTEAEPRHVADATVR